MSGTRRRRAADAFERVRAIGRTLPDVETDTTRFTDVARSTLEYDSRLIARDAPVLRAIRGASRRGDDTTTRSGRTRASPT